MARAHTFLSALVFVGILAAVNAAGDAPFCRGIVDRLLQCPVVPTVDTIDLNSYTGRWYEIGVSAQFAFAFFGQQGAQCVRANYTGLGVVDGRNTIKVQNSALSVSSTAREVQALAISQGAFASGAGVRFLCQFLVGDQSLGSLIPALSKADKFLPNLAKLTSTKLFKSMVGDSAGKEALKKLHNVIQKYATNRRLKSLTDDEISAIVDALVDALARLPTSTVQRGAGVLTGAIKGALSKTNMLKGGSVSQNDLEQLKKDVLAAAAPGAAAVAETAVEAFNAGAGPAGAPVSASDSSQTQITPETEKVVNSMSEQVVTELTKTEWEGIIKSGLEMVTMFATMPNGTINTPISIVGLASIITVATTVSDALSAAEKKKISGHVGTILNAVDRASFASSEVFKVLESVQGTNNILTGAGYPKPINVSKAQNDIDNEIRKLISLEKLLNTTRQVTLKAAADILAIAAGKDQAVARAAYAITVFASERGPISLAIKDISVGGTTISFTSSTLSPENVTPTVNNIEGRAVQSPTNAGALTVSFFGPPTGPPNYNIIKLEGEAFRGYELALVYSCSADFTSAFLPENALFILSRKATVPRSVIDQALIFAAKNNILLAGENPFLTVSQDDTLCKPLA